VRIVIAEDMALLRQGLTRLLTDAGFDVAGGAVDADELLEIVARSEPDAALIDIKIWPRATPTTPSATSWSSPAGPWIPCE
jgi:DNA-binding NarL/FixJ family response regulator